MYNHKRGKQDYKAGAQRDPKTGLYPGDYYNCATYDLTAKRSEQKCCSHFITTKAVRALVLEAIKTASAYAVSDEKSFVEKVRATSKIQQESAAKELKIKLGRNRKRSVELDNLIKKLYESYANGKISEKRFEVLSAGYEPEQEELEATVQREQAELDSFHADTDRADKFLELVKKYTDFSVLTTPMLLEFVDKILVHAPEKVDGERVQEIDIYLRFIGKVDIPTPEPTPEELAEQEKKRLLRKKSREYARKCRAKKRAKLASE